ncbi:MAG: hypothetical protein QXO86_02580 [Nitrososphaerota archaeon]
MSEKNVQNPDESDEEESIEINQIETPRGRVPEFESTFRALEKISARLLEQDEKIEKVATQLTSRHLPTVQVKEIQDAIQALRSDIAELEKRLEYMEDILGEIQERLNLLDYLADIVERYLKTQES